MLFIANVSFVEGIITKSKRLIYILIAWGLYSCTPQVDSPYPPISFHKIESMPGNGRASAVAFVIQDKAYICLGRNKSVTFVDESIATQSSKDCWEYDPSTNTWNERKPFPGNERVNALAQVVNDTAYVGLGYKSYYGAYTELMSGAIGNLKDFWRFVVGTDSTADQWTKMADFPSKATVACVSFVYDNCIYVGAGFDDVIFTKEFWKYSPLLNTWTRLNDFPGSYRSGSVLCADSNHVYYGTGFNGESLNDWWEYFPANDSWKKCRPLPTNGRINGVAIAIRNRYFVATGRRFGGDLTGGHLKADILEYDPIRNVWYKRGFLPPSGRENAISFTINGKGYIGLGENDKEIFNDIYSFTVD
jgi:N-acetylneuraminic acid mutarotase